MHAKRPCIERRTTDSERYMSSQGNIDDDECYSAFVRDTNDCMTSHLRVVEKRRSTVTAMPFNTSITRVAHR